MRPDEADEKTPLLGKLWGKKNKRHTPLLSPVDEGDHLDSVTVVQPNGIQTPHQPINASDEDSADKKGDTQEKPVLKRGIFLAKVYLVIMIQMLIAAGTTALFWYIPHLRKVFRELLSVYLTAVSLTLAGAMIFCFCSSYRRTNPFWPFAFFTAFGSFQLAMIAAAGGAIGILYGCVICAICSLFFAIISVIPKMDLTSFFGLILVPLCTGGLFTLMYFYTRWTLANEIGSAVGATLVMMVLWFGSRRLIRGDRHQLGPKDVLFAALQSYFEVGIAAWKKCKSWCS